MSTLNLHLNFKLVRLKWLLVHVTFCFSLWSLTHCCKCCLLILSILLYYVFVEQDRQFRRSFVIFMCLFSQVNVEHMDRFSTKFGSEEHEGNEENGQDSENAKPQKSSKPSDFQVLFDGNNEDDFMIGIKFTR